jgi:hypothetical protein
MHQLATPLLNFLQPTLRTLAGPDAASYELLRMFVARSQKGSGDGLLASVKEEGLHSLFDLEKPTFFETADGLQFCFSRCYHSPGMS